jgi:hypothetical protein
MRIRPTPALAGLLGVLAVAGMVGVSCLPGRTGVTVTVTNTSDTDITDLQIQYTGGQKSVPKLHAAATYRTKVNPNSSSALHITFTDGSAQRHAKKLDVYFERNYRGAIHVTIQSNGMVTWKDETRI